MRHLVNFGLLFSFVALAITGGLAYFRPFNLTTTHIHLLSGFITIALVVSHLCVRLHYFRKQINKKQTRGGFRLQLIIMLILFAGLLYAAVKNIAPVAWLSDGSYEARNRAEIVRTSSLAAFSEPAPHRKLITRVCRKINASGLSVLLHFPEDLPTMPAIAVWAESTTGSMIETIYLEQSIAYSTTPLWEGYRTERHHILPLWRHRYTLISGIDPSGEVDATTGATQSHQYALDPYLIKGEGHEFVICVEINAPNDTSEYYPDTQFGQPSLLYSCRVNVDSNDTYYLLELTGHGGGDAIDTGNIQYDFSKFSSALHMKDLFLLKVEK